MPSLGGARQDALDALRQAGGACARCGGDQQPGDQSGARGEQPLRHVQAECCVGGVKVAARPNVAMPTTVTRVGAAM
jgi:hypothetical protein